MLVNEGCAGGKLFIHLRQTHKRYNKLRSLDFGSKYWPYSWVFMIIFLLFRDNGSFTFDIPVVGRSDTQSYNI